MTKKSASSSAKKKPARSLASATPRKDYAGQVARMYQIHDRLKRKITVTVDTLREECGMARRTVLRDITLMREEHGAPITYSRKLNSYIYTEPYEFLPRLRLTGPEALALAMSARRFGAAPGSLLGRAFPSLLQKLGPMLDEDTSFSLDALKDVFVQPNRLAAREDRHLPVVHEARTLRRELRIVYQKPGDEPKARTIRPLHLAYVGNGWMLLARDVREPNQDRNFMLSRMHEAEMTTTRFERPADFDAEKILRGSLRRFTGQGEHEIKIALDAFAAAYARDEPWHESQDLQPLPDGRFMLTLKLNNLVDVEQDALSWGLHAEVLAPAELREKMRVTAEGLHARYARPNPA